MGAKAPKKPSRIHKDAPKSPPRRPQEAPDGPQDPPKGGPRGPQEAPRGHKNSNKITSQVKTAKTSKLMTPSIKINDCLSKK